MAVMILSMAVAGITQAVLSGQQQMNDALHSRCGMTLAESMMERIVALDYNDPNGVVTPGPESAGVYDNIDDYHGFTETTGNCKDAAGAAYSSDFATFRRSVTCVYGSQTVTGFAAAIPGITVTVTVTDTKGRTWILTRFVAAP